MTYQRHRQGTASKNEKRNLSTRYCDAHTLGKEQISHRFSINKICIAAYAMTMKALEKMARPMTSVQMASASKPKAERMEAPGTSMSRPYLWSTRVRYLTSLTIRASKP